jgi:hypothetical protein
LIPVKVIKLRGLRIDEVGNRDAVAIDVDRETMKLGNVSWVKAERAYLQI